jgi:hypothetical protein
MATHTATTDTSFDAHRRISSETKPSFKTTELVAYVVVTIAVLIAAQVADDFDAEHAWLYASLLTIGYMVSRGLAKSGARNFYDDDHRDHTGTRHSA